LNADPSIPLSNSLNTDKSLTPKEEALINILTAHQQNVKNSSYVFHKDEKNDRTFLLDTGANRNLVDASVLTTAEKLKINSTVHCEISNFTAGMPKVQCLGTVELNLGDESSPIVLKFEVMPECMLNYNLIGIQDILQYFLKSLTNAKRQRNSAGGEANLSNARESPPDEFLTLEEAEAYLSTLPLEECPPKPKQKDIMDQTWFKKVWGLFPRLQDEIKNLQEESRLPYECEIELKPGARLFFQKMYHLSERSAREMAQFLVEAEHKGIIERGLTTCRSSSFMVPKSDPSLPQRMVVDLGMLNNIAIPKDANLPRTDQLPYDANRGKYLSKLDLTKGFYHVSVAQKS